MNFNSDQETQEPQQTSSSDESPDMSGGDETAYLSSDKKPANTQMIALVGLLVVGAGVIGFMYLRNGPSTAAARTPARNREVVPRQRRGARAAHEADAAEHGQGRPAVPHLPVADAGSAGEPADQPLPAATRPSRSRSPRTRARPPPAAA